GDADLDGGQELVGIAGQPGDQPPSASSRRSWPSRNEIRATSLPAKAALTTTSTNTNPTSTHGIGRPPPHHRQRSPARRTTHRGSAPGQGRISISQSTPSTRRPTNG